MIDQPMKKVELVSNWRYWHRKWSTWLIGLIPILTALREALPALQELIPLPTYKLIMGVLAFVAIVASQIKQQSIQVPPHDPHPTDDQPQPEEQQ